MILINDGGEKYPNNRGDPILGSVWPRSGPANYKFAVIFSFSSYTPRIMAGHFNECGLWTAPVLADHFFDPSEVAFLRFQAGLDDCFIAWLIPEGAGVVFSHPILPDVETQEVEPDLSILRIERVDDTGFTGFQAQSHFSQPFFGDLLEFVECFQVMVQDHEIIGVANDCTSSEQMGQKGLFVKRHFSCG